MASRNSHLGPVGHRPPTHCPESWVLEIMASRLVSQQPVTQRSTGEVGLAASWHLGRWAGVGAGASDFWPAVAGGPDTHTWGRGQRPRAALHSL